MPVQQKTNPADVIDAGGIRIAVEGRMLPPTAEGGCAVFAFKIGTQFPFALIDRESDLIASPIVFIFAFVAGTLVSAFFDL